MRQSEKLDIILQRLYESRFDGKYYSIRQILADAGVLSSFDEVFALGEKLEEKGFIKFAGSFEGGSGTITTDGIMYCEEDSFTGEGNAIINKTYSIKIENSPGANIVNQSNNVTITPTVSDIAQILDDLISTISEDRTVSSVKIQEIQASIQEIRANLNSGQVPRGRLLNLIGLIGDISSIAGFGISLSALIK
jgi:hypothetical protein